MVEKQPSLSPARRVAILVYDHLRLFEFSLAYEVFRERPEMQGRWYETRVVSLDGRPVTVENNLSLVPESDASFLSAADMIVVAGWATDEEAPPEELIKQLQRAHARGARLVSICSGSFLLGYCGLLDEREATTHWLYAEELQTRFPQSIILHDVLYTQAGSIFTSAGSAAGIDLCLHVVRADFGAEAANTVARRMVVAGQRDGGQKQFIERPVPSRHESGRLGKVFDLMRQDLQKSHRVPQLAALAGMSERTFVRRFKDTTGLPPLQWLIRERILAGRDLLETTRLSVQEIASKCGFSEPGDFRRNFKKQVGVGPKAFRASFGHPHSD